MIIFFEKLATMQDTEISCKVSFDYRINAKLINYIYELSIEHKYINNKEYLMKL